MQQLTVSSAETAVVIGDSDEIVNGFWMSWVDDKPTHIKIPSINHHSITQIIISVT